MRWSRAAGRVCRDEPTHSRPGPIDLTWTSRGTVAGQAITPPLGLAVHAVPPDADGIRRHPRARHVALSSGREETEMRSGTDGFVFPGRARLFDGGEAVRQGGDCRRGWTAARGAGGVVALQP